MILRRIILLHILLLMYLDHVVQNLYMQDRWENQGRNILLLPPRQVVVVQGKDFEDHIPMRLNYLPGRLRIHHLLPNK